MQTNPTIKMSLNSIMKRLGSRAEYHGSAITEEDCCALQYLESSVEDKLQLCPEIVSTRKALEATKHIITYMEIIDDYDTKKAPVAICFINSQQGWE